MEVRVGILFLIVLGAAWACAARQIVDDEVSRSNIVISDVIGQELENEKAVGNEQVCTLCEEFASQALDYLHENKTQSEIISLLHQACTRVRSFTEQCITLVDYYAPLFFKEVSSVQPEAFCRKVDLCQQIVQISSKFQQDRCVLCHRAVSEVLLKLKNPDTQLEIIELLLKGCDSMENYASKCKRLVFEYGPIIITNAEQFLETRDICTMLHACDATQFVSDEAATVVKADS